MSFQAGTPGAIQQPPASASYLGQGIAYPLTINSQGRLALSVGQQCVVDAMSAIVQTQPGERVMQPDFGGDIGTFEPLEIGRFKANLEATVANHEPRVQSVDVNLQIGQSMQEAQLNVSFQIVGQATPQVLTFPYFQGPST